MIDYRKQLNKDKVDLIIDDFLNGPYFNQLWEHEYDLLRKGFKSLLKSEKEKFRKIVEESKKFYPFNEFKDLFNQKLAEKYKEKWNKEMDNILKKLDEK